jgi:hypothetical protein
MKPRRKPLPAQTCRTSYAVPHNRMKSQQLPMTTLGCARLNGTKRKASSSRHRQGSVAPATTGQIIERPSFPNLTSKWLRPIVRAAFCRTPGTIYHSTEPSPASVVMGLPIPAPAPVVSPAFPFLPPAPLAPGASLFRAFPACAHQAIDELAAKSSPRLRAPPQCVLPLTVLRSRPKHVIWHPSPFEPVTKLPCPRNP